MYLFVLDIIYSNILAAIGSWNIVCLAERMVPGSAVFSCLVCPLPASTLHFGFGALHGYLLDAYPSYPTTVRSQASPLPSLSLSLLSPFCVVGNSTVVIR